VGAIDEVVEDGRTGLMVPPLDPEAIAGATERLLEDGERRRVFGESGRRSAIEKLGVSASANLQERVIREAIAHRAARRRDSRDRDV
jgi:glycosyltransferase involved in cell wall biosynthesis